jgi:DNA helicase-2/ATP-dependent DNA helicase PcrA
VLVNPGDRLSFDRVLNKPPRGIGDRSRELLAGWMDSSGLPASEAMRRVERVPGIPRAARESMARLGAFLEKTSALAAGGAPALEVIDAVLAGSGMLDALDASTPEGAQRLENLEEFRRSALEFDGRAPGEGLAGFLSSISLLTSADDYDPSAGRLYLMTLHCAKGLEFDVVFVAGVEEGLLPFTRPGRFAPDDLEEERRLLYVGMTRAREALHLTWAARRLRPGSPFCGPSRFISEALSGRSCPAGRAADAGEPEQAASQEFRKGMTIHHPRYGGGRVVAAVRRGSEWQLTVDFGMDEPKVLLTGYVPITVTGEARTRR